MIWSFSFLMRMFKNGSSLNLCSKVNFILGCMFWSIYIYIYIHICVYLLLCCFSNAVTTCCNILHCLLFC